MLNAWLERWNHWVGDRGMERAIRDQLRAAGYRGQSSQIVDFRLVAIERPGWVCVYQFGVHAVRSDGVATELFGAAREDARRSRAIRLFQDRQARDAQRTAWSDGLIAAPNLDVGL